MISGEQLKREGRKQFCKHGHDTYVCGRYNAGDCPKCSNQRTRNWAKQNPKIAAATSTRWRRKHPHQAYLRTKRWRKNNPEIYLAGVRRRSKRYRQKYPERKRAECAKRRALKHLVTIGDLTEIAKIYARSYELRRQGFNVNVDHIIPLSKGGAHSPDNLQIISAFENNRKFNSLTYVPKVVFT